MLSRKNIVVVQPSNILDSKLGMQNSKITKVILDAPLGVNTSPPHTYHLIDISKHTSPRDARLERERDQSIELDKYRSNQRMAENQKRLAISNLRSFSPFSEKISSNWTSSDLGFETRAQSIDPGSHQYFYTPDGYNQSINSPA